jgi:chromosome segregation ATPase
MRDEGDAELSTLQKSVDDCDKTCGTQRAALQRCDLLLDTKRAELEKNASEYDKKRSELATVVSAKSALQLAERDFEEAKSSEDEFMKSYASKSNEAKKQVKDASDEIRALSEQISSDAELLQTLSMHRSEIAALTAAERQVTSDKHQLAAETHSVLETHRDALSGCGQRAPDSLLRDAGADAGANAAAEELVGSEAEALAPLVSSMTAAGAAKQSELKTLREKLG